MSMALARQSPKTRNPSNRIARSNPYAAHRSTLGVLSKGRPRSRATGHTVVAPGRFHVAAASRASRQ